MIVFVQIKFIKLLLFLENTYIEILTAFDTVVHACFGDKLDEYYETYINDFFLKLKKTKISITPKIHCLLFHVADFCNVSNRGLGFYSEQSSEQIHHVFNKHSENFVANKCSPDYSKQLLRSVCALNSQHQ